MKPIILYDDFSLKLRSSLLKFLKSINEKDKEVHIEKIKSQKIDLNVVLKIITMDFFSYYLSSNNDNYKQSTFLSNEYKKFNDLETSGNTDIFTLKEVQLGKKILNGMIDIPINDDWVKIAKSFKFESFFIEIESSMFEAFGTTIELPEILITPVPYFEYWDSGTFNEEMFWEPSLSNKFIDGVYVTFYHKIMISIPHNEYMTKHDIIYAVLVHELFHSGFAILQDEKNYTQNHYNFVFEFFEALVTYMSIKVLERHGYKIGAKLEEGRLKRSPFFQKFNTFFNLFNWKELCEICNKLTAYSVKIRKSIYKLSKNIDLVEKKYRPGKPQEKMRKRYEKRLETTASGKIRRSAPMDRDGFLKLFSYIFPDLFQNRDEALSRIGPGFTKPTDVRFIIKIIEGLSVKEPKNNENIRKALSILKLREDYNIDL